MRGLEKHNGPAVQCENPGEVDYHEFILVPSLSSVQVSPALLGGLLQAEEYRQLDSSMVEVFSVG